MVPTNTITSAQMSLLSPNTCRSGRKRSISENTTRPSSITTKGSRIRTTLAEGSAAASSVSLRLLECSITYCADSISASIEAGALDNECLQSGRVDGVALVEIDGTNRLTVQTRVEEPFRIP